MDCQALARVCTPGCGTVSAGPMPTGTPPACRVRNREERWSAPGIRGRGAGCKILLLKRPPEGLCLPGCGSFSTSREPIRTRRGTSFAGESPRAFRNGRAHPGTAGRVISRFSHIKWEMNTYYLRRLIVLEASKSGTPRGKARHRRGSCRDKLAERPLPQVMQKCVGASGKALRLSGHGLHVLETPISLHGEVVRRQQA